MKEALTGPGHPCRPGARVPSGVELRHLRYFAVLAAAGSFTRAAELLFVAQPTLSQQIRRLEGLVGAQLLHRRPDGVRLTAAGVVFLEASRDVLSRMDHGMSQTRQVAGVGRQRLRVVVPPALPDGLAVATTSALWTAAAAAHVDVMWTEAPLDASFSLIRQRRADAGLGWLAIGPETLPPPLDAMSLGEFEPDVWIPDAHPAARRAAISLGELAQMKVIYGPHRAKAGIHDAWSQVMRQENPDFEFTDPPLQHSMPVALAFAATAEPPAAVLTEPGASARPKLIRRPDPVSTHGMVPVTLEGRPLTAVAAVVWNGALPTPLQQVLFDAAEGVAAPDDFHSEQGDLRLRRPLAAARVKRIGG